jgi:glyoxylate reductase
MRHKVFVTRKIPTAGMQMLRKHFVIELNPHERLLTKNELIGGLQGCAGLLCMLTDRIDSEVMDASPGLRVISNYAVGCDNVDVTGAMERGILVTNTPGVLTETTADLAFCLLMAIGRRIVESDSYTRRGKFKGWSPMILLGQDVYRKTLGIFGLGRIGKALARRAAQGFEMSVLYYGTKQDHQSEKEIKARYVDKDTLLSQSEFVSIILPLFPSTYHFIGAREMALMKPSACLINTARGAVVDEKTLVSALRKKQIFGAALDVFEHEPEISKELLRLDNVIAVPHIGSATVESRQRMAVMAAENLVEGLTGERSVSVTRK